jgi:hypothetical protein
MVSGKIGLGKSEGNHLFATAMMAKESLHPKRVDSLLGPFFPSFQSALRPGRQADLLAGSNRGRRRMDEFPPGKQGWRSLYPGLDTVSWTQSLLRSAPDSGTSVVSTTPGGSQSHHPTDGKIMAIQPGYYSMAAPLLITDRKRYEVRTDQSLWKGRFTLSAYAKRDFDNLLPYKITRTTVTSAGVNLRFRAKKLPYLQLNFAPLYRENTRTDSLRISDQISVLSASSGYSFQVGGISSTTSLVYSQQISRSLSGKTDFRAYLANLSQVIAFSIPFSLNLSGSYIHSAWSQDFNQTWTADVSGSFTLFQKWSSTFGGMLMDEKGNSRRKGLYMSSSYPIWKQMQLEVQIQQFLFDPYLEGRGQRYEWVYRGGVSYRW